MEHDELTMYPFDMTINGIMVTKMVAKRFSLQWDYEVSSTCIKFGTI